MIQYENDLFGFRSLLRVHGSAVYKVMLPSLFSTGLILIFDFFVPQKDDVVSHTYAVGVLIVFFSFLITFRLNMAYGRYWEGATAVQQMQSKWLDCAMAVASFHYQAEQFQDIRPPSFGDQPDLSKRQISGRERDFEMMSFEDSARMLVTQMECGPSDLQAGERRRSWGLLRRRRPSTRATLSERQGSGKSINSAHPQQQDSESTIPIPLRFQRQFRAQPSQRRRNLLVKQSRAYMKLGSSERRIRLPKPSLFLEELAHLVSLLSAIAMSTLRFDSECAEVPVTEYFPGNPWPAVDPDDLSKDIKEEYEEANPVWAIVSFCLGLNRTEHRRTLYNKARPFGVLGGVSDSEVKLLYEAHGPYAKVALCTMWLEEFISRESLSGSTGRVPGPIISRLYQYISDGVVGYNQARKVAYMPFPFPHSQISAFFSLVIIFIFPILFYSFVNDRIFACILNFVTVLCFLGLHEVARELENPMQNAPNDLPLTTFQAQFNEALVTVYAGMHPDSWWDVKPDLEQSSEGEEEE